MFQSFEGIRESRRGSIVTSPVASAFVHVAAIALVLFVASRTPRIRVVKLPGSASGTHMLLTYSTGGVQSEAKSFVKHEVVAVSKAALPSKPMPVPSEAKAAPMAEQGSNSAGMSGLGDGDMTIALVTKSPQPQLDLSSLSHGQAGNVILNAVIDANGAITELTVLQSLGASIDQQVIATVRNWSFKPAMKNGQPVTSEQEIILHYERA
jgi:protein TonB